LWSRSIGDSFSNSGNAVAVDPSGHVRVTGAFAGPADFGGGALTSAGVDIFLAKLSPAGGHVWSRRFGSALATHAGNGVACDGSGNVLVTGSFENSIDLGGGWARSFAHKDVFVAKYSPAGAYLWSRLAGGIYDDAGRGIAVDASGQVAVTGIFQAAVNFGTGSLISAGRTDIFVVRYAADGTPLGAQRFGGAGWIWMLPRIIVPRSLANTVVPGGCTNGRVQQIALATSIVVWPAAGPRMCIS